MRFKLYDIYFIGDNKLETVSSEKLVGTFFDELNKYPKVQDGQDYYAPLYMKEYNDYILGTLVQSYTTLLTTFDDDENSKEEKAIDTNVINDKTYFYINKLSSQLFIQSKRYPTTLNLLTTIDRLSSILGDCLGGHIALLPGKLNYTMDEIKELFQSHDVKKIIFKNMQGLKLPEGSQLHNPRKDLDDSLVESWNVYSADTVDYLELRAKENEKLSKNPLAKIGMVLSYEYKSSNVFQKMEIIDDGERVAIKPEGNESKIIYISRKTQDDPYDTYEKILKKNVKGYTNRLDE